jgi:hypothetical protein
MSGSLGSGCTGDPTEGGLESVVRENESTREKVEYLRTCEVCERQFLSSRRTTRSCGRKECRLLIAEFEDFLTLRFILENSRWAGAASQQELQKEYFRQQLSAGIRRLPQSEDALFLALAEIYAETEA